MNILYKSFKIKTKDQNRLTETNETWQLSAFITWIKLLKFKV